MELFQGARDKRELAHLRRFLLVFDVMPLSEDIGYRASIYLEEYALKAGLRLADSLIAATAVERRLALCSGNVRHYRAISDIELKLFRPRSSTWGPIPRHPSAADRPRRAGSRSACEAQHADGSGRNAHEWS